MDNPNPYGRPPLSRREKSALAVAAIVVLALAIGVGGYMMTHKPRPERRKPVPSTLVVSVEELSPISTNVTVTAQGTVIPALEVDLKARVSGEVTWTASEFVEGGIVRKGQALARIDPTEYELALTRAKSTLQSALLNLKSEQGRQEIARSEWEILGLEERATELDRELALRQPQIMAIEAQLEAARADVKQAELNLERTVVRAPFNAAVLSVNVDPGAQTVAQSVLGRLSGSDSFYVEALIPLDRLGWIDIPENNRDTGSIARVSATNGRTTRGKVYKLLPELQAGGRQARVLIEVDDPLELLKGKDERRPLLLGDYVSAAIEGRPIENVFRIPREYLRDGRSVYLADENDRLEIREVEIAWSAEDDVLVRGVRAGERLIVSYVAAPVEGMEIKVQESEFRSQEPGGAR